MFSSWYPITIAGAAHEEGVWPLQMSLALEQALGAWVCLQGPVRGPNSQLHHRNKNMRIFFRKVGLEEHRTPGEHTHTHTPLIPSPIFMKTQL